MNRSIIVCCIIPICWFLNVGVSFSQAEKDHVEKTEFKPAENWLDKNGKPINAHGGGVIFYQDKYYWYGEHKLAGSSEKTFADAGIHCYSSVDLINWQDEGIVLSVDFKNEKTDLAYGCILERPKVVYNKKNKQFVAFFKLYLKGLGYETSNVGVAIADKPTGPFIYHHKFQGGGSPKGSGDFSMFTDDDGSLYHLTVRKPDKVFVIGKLDSDYYYPLGEYKPCEGIELHTEAPVVIKRNGIYHLLGSGSSGWKPNAARYYTSENIMGKWTYHGNPCIGTNHLDSVGSEVTYGGQSSYIFPIEGKKDAYIVMFDIWKPENPITGRYIWLPIEFSKNQMLIRWQDTWNLSYLNRQVETKSTTISPGQIWNDTDGNPINAHGGGILYYKGIYYWYGTHKIEGLSEKTFADGGIHCYASEDLINWSDKGLVLPLVYNDDSHDLAYQCNFDRPKVVYNSRTKNFVAFFKLYLKGQGVSTGYVGVALSNNPTGPFKYSHKFLGADSPNGSGDYAIFQEPNGDLYHLTVRKPDKVFVVGKMNQDYLYPEGKYEVCKGITGKTEGPAIVKLNGIYHLIGSGSTGWDPNPARYFTSKSLTGPWVLQGNPCEGINPQNGFGQEKTYGGQPTFIMSVVGMQDAYIAMFDINKPDNPFDSRHIWLPISIKENKFVISWRDSWSMNAFGNKTEDLIAASQTGASPLFFNPSDYAAPVIQTNHFSHPNEFNIRSGLPNFFNKVKKGQAVTIGYLGGSITRANNQYRAQSAKFIQQLFPTIKMTGINAGVSGTGTDLGACRVYDQVLKFNPDLVFVEFAVNGAFPDGMEGIVRQIWKYNPRIDICFIYTTAQGQTKIYAEGIVPENIQHLEKIADYYAIPSVHMGLQAAYLESKEKLIWKADPAVLTEKIVFSADGTHPLEAGGNLYAEAIARAMLKMKRTAGSQVHRLAEPLIADNWEDAKMLDPKSIASFSSEWVTIDPNKVESLNQFSPWFPYVMKAENPGSSISFKFDGTMIGIFDIGGPEVGQIELELDGILMNLKELSPINFIAGNEFVDTKLINRFNRNCNNRYRGQCAFIKTKPGIHSVVLKISKDNPDKIKILGEMQLEDISKNPEKYNHTVVYLGKILLRGEVLASR